MTTAIACASGSFRVSFVNGVLSILEGASFRADAYAAASASVIPAGYAALGRIADLKGADYWKHFITFLEEHNYDASQGVLKGIEVFGPLLRDNLFKEDVPRFLISTSAVVTDEAAQQTQGEKARRLGQRLLLASRNNDRSWADQHLASHMFGTINSEVVLPLTPDNLGDVIYASTRLLQSWKIAATIEEKPYIDASYTCSCPAIELAELGFNNVIAIIPEPGTVYRDIFQSEVIPGSWNDSVIHFVQPDISLGDIKVDYMSATPTGLEAAFQLGEEKGDKFISWFMARDMGS